MLENRVYNEDSTPTEIEAIRNRVYMFEEGIVWINELNKVSPFTINLLFDRVDELSSDLDTFAMVIDLRGSSRPDARGRRVLNKRFQAVAPKLIHCSYITGQNLLINTAIRFVMFGSGAKSFSVDAKEEDGIKKLRDAIKG